MSNGQQFPSPIIKKKRWFTRWWGILIIIFIVFFITVAIIFIVQASIFIKQIREGTIDLSQYSSEELSKADFAPSTASREGVNVIDADDPWIGKEDAVLVIVEFSDFECPYCGQEYTVVREITSQYKDKIKFIYRDFPIKEIHSYAQKAAEAGMCAYEQGKFWELHDKLFISQDRLDITSLKQYAVAVGLDSARFDTCLDSGKYAAEVEKDLADGINAGVSGTPTFFFNGYKVSGLIPKATFEEIINLFVK